MTENPNTIPIKQEMAMRGQIIVRTSLVGIVVNILLAAFKAAVVTLTPQYALTGVVVSVVISMIAGILPSNHASKLDPVDALRKE